MSPTLLIDQSLISSAIRGEVPHDILTTQEKAYLVLNVLLCSNEVAQQHLPIVQAPDAVAGLYTLLRRDRVRINPEKATLVRVDVIRIKS
jgi:hypothetical protein